MENEQMRNKIPQQYGSGTDGRRDSLGANFGAGSRPYGEDTGTGREHRLNHSNLSVSHHQREAIGCVYAEYGKRTDDKDHLNYDRPALGSGLRYEHQHTQDFSHGTHGNYNQRNVGNDEPGYQRSPEPQYRRDRYHRGKGTRSYKRSDERIMEDINDGLMDDPYIHAAGIEVRVNNGEVALTGVVEDRLLKRKAEDIAASISGVVKVENKIRIAATN
ncbi:MAG TPA: BON domain-containing protein [Ohtaekwangia sp.]|nr:BON domain-containing protein [Ohtaekwangia sp.]